MRARALVVILALLLSGYASALDESYCKHNNGGLAANHYTILCRVSPEGPGFGLRCDGTVELMGGWDPDAVTVTLLTILSEALAKDPRFAFLFGREVNKAEAGS